MQIQGRQYQPTFLIESGIGLNQGEIQIKGIGNFEFAELAVRKRITLSSPVNRYVVDYTLRVTVIRVSPQCILLA